MSIQRVTSTEPLTDAECRSWAPARAKRLAYSIAGRARYLYEMATGESAADDGGGTPLNPQGFIGADRSGPPFGDAHMHPLWWFGMTLNNTSSIYAGTGANGTRAMYLNEQGTIRRIVARFWIRPFARGRLKPYRRAYLRGLGTSDDLVTTSAATIRIYGEDGESGPFMSAAVSTTSQAAFGTTAYTLVRPGWNERIIEIEQTSANGIYIGPLSLNQIVRRTHT